MGRLDEQDRREVHRIFDKAQGRMLIRYETERAYGYPADEAGVIRFFFEGGLAIEFRPTGYDPDGIAVDEYRV